MLGAEVDPLSILGQADVKQEELPSVDIDGVIDLTDVWKPVTEDTDSGSSNDDSSSSDSSSVDDTVTESVPASVEPLTNLDCIYFINVKSLVIHARKTQKTFKCGRVLSATYQPVPELNGFRCGRCFPD